jgi:parallel beta-helix repeat protein
LVEIEADVWNASGVAASEFEVAVYTDHPDSGGTVIDSQVLSDFWGWERRRVTFDVNDVSAGDLGVYLFADAAGQQSEIDETNNLIGVAGYIYPCESGFPLKIGDDIEGHVVADLNCDGKPDILVTSGGTQAQGIDFDGTTLWTRSDLGLTQWFDGIEPAVCDLNGDGATEAIVTSRASVIVLEGATGSTIWKKYTDYPVLSPVVTDIDSDALFEVLMPTYSFSFSTLIAFSASGGYRWVHSLPTYGEKLTGVAVCDVELDGYKEVIYGTDDGNLTCLTCSDDPPSTVWEEPLSAQGISCVAAGDLLRDGTIELVVGCGDTVYVLAAADGQEISAIGCPCEVTRLSLGDLDGDDDLEIVCNSECGRVFEIDDGQVVLDIDTGGTLTGCPSLADLNQDGTVEVIVAIEEGQVQILSGSTDLIPPVPMRGACLSCPSANDIDDDGNIEIIAGSSDSLLFMLDLGTAGGRIEWVCSGGTLTRTGLYAQPVYGSISNDVALSGRIDVVGDIIVEDSTSLVLYRGADVRFVHDEVFSAGSAPGQCEIIVNGNLYATGSQSGSVRLGPVAVPYNSDAWAGILIEEGGYASLSNTTLFGAVTGIECRTSDVNIQECTIRNCMMGIKLDEASPLIDHNRIIQNDYGISASGSTPAIVGNNFTSNFYSGIILSNSSDATLEDNVVKNTVQGHGLSVYSSSPTLLGRNRFEGNSLCGIYLSNSSPAIDSCWIGYNGDCGIKAAYYSDPVIRATSLVGNYIGISVYIYADPILGDTLTGLGGSNDIRDNTQYALYNKTPNNIKAQGNWWGTDSPDPSLFMGSVDYSGWLVTSPAGVEDTPAGLALVQKIYPNPFVTTVRLQLSVTERQLPLSVDVYDIRGRLLRTLETMQVPGAHILTWDGNDMYGRPVASGTYFISVNSRTASYTSKVILLR